MDPPAFKLRGHSVAHAPAAQPELRVPAASLQVSLGRQLECDSGSAGLMPAGRWCPSGWPCHGHGSCLARGPVCGGPGGFGPGLPPLPTTVACRYRPGGLPTRRPARGGPEIQETSQIRLGRPPACRANLRAVWPEEATLQARACGSLLWRADGAGTRRRSRVQHRVRRRSGSAGCRHCTRRIKRTIERMCRGVPHLRRTHRRI